MAVLEVEGHRRIVTPDQRLRVFVSSSMHELAAEREAAAGAIAALRLIPVLFELGARPHSPQDLYRAYLEQSHIFVGIYWESYGWVAAGEEISGLEDEYELSRPLPRLLYVKEPAPAREPALREFLAGVEADASVSYKEFRTPSELAELLASDLALLLSERFEEVGPEQAVPARDGDRRLPRPATPLIGRKWEFAEMRELMLVGDVQLLTLTGPGGTGKTRLALALAESVYNDFRDGATLVSLEALEDPALVLPTLAEALGVSEARTEAVAEAISEYLRARELLLVIDNFEHVLEAAPELARLLTAAPGVKVIVTSREPLHLSIEHEFVVPPLAVNEAFELFCVRAEAVRPQFTADGVEADAIAAICERLDRLPLAIELAAAWSRLLPPTVLLRRIEERLDLLGDGPRDAADRQRTLRGALEWSYRLLSLEQQTLLCCLSVFAGGATLEGVEAVCRDCCDDLFGTLLALNAKNLIQRRDAAGEPRFVMLQTVREYALERLEESGDAPRLRRQHAEYFVAVAERAEQPLAGPGRSEWLRRLDADVDNLTAALTWSLAQASPELGLRLSAALFRYWEARARLGEIGRFLAEALAREATLPPSVYARAIRQAARVALIQSDYERSGSLYQQALPLLRELDDRSLLAFALSESGWIAMITCNFGQAVAFCEEAVTVARAIDDKVALSSALNNLGGALGEQGDYERASELLEEALTLQRDFGGPHVATALCNVGLFQLRRGDIARARSQFEEAAEIARANDDRRQLASAVGMLGWAAVAAGDTAAAEAEFSEGLEHYHLLGEERYTADCLQGLACAAASRGDALRAAWLWGAAEALLEAINAPPSPADRAFQQPYLDAAQAAVADKAWKTATHEGATAPLEHAIAYACEPAVSAAARAGTGDGVVPLARLR